MKITLNELKIMIKTIIKEEQENKYETKPIKNHGEDAKKNTHYAIHKATNAVATMWDYSDRYPEKPIPPKDKNNKRAMTIYKNKMEEYKYELKDAEGEFKLDKDAFFFDDLKDDVGGNMKKFNKADFIIVKKDDLEKRGINLDNYLQFIGDIF